MSLLFKFCPFCGGQVPPNEMVKFCPFCGEKFIVTENTNKDSSSETLIVVEEQLEVSALPIPHHEYVEIRIDGHKRKKLREIIGSECYSIILKNAPNKPGLVRKLEKVLLRGSFAIRLAIDTIPSIIVYKAKSEDVLYLNEVFTSEQASTSVVAGDFDNKPAIEEIFTMFNTLHAKVQTTIKQLPINLWIGDRIRGVFPSTYCENDEGITIIGDKNIFFIPNEIATRTPPWFVRSYHLLSKVVVDNDCLQLTYKDDVVTSISFAKKEGLAQAYQCIYHAVEI